MRLPSRSLLTGIGLVLASLTFAQTQDSTSPPAVEGKKSLTKPQNRTVTRVESPAPVPAVSAEATPQPVGYESDIYCFGYVGNLSETFDAEVKSAENLDSQVDYMTGDLLYINAGYDRGLKIGDMYWLVTGEQEIFHPVTRASMGRIYQYRGRATVHSVEPHSAIVRVTSACTEIPLGTYLKKFEPIPIPLARKTPLAQAGDPPSGKTTGYVVFSLNGLVAVGSDTSVIVDLGAANGIQPGDFLTVFHYSVGTDYGLGPLGAFWVNRPPPPGVSVPRTYLGELGVLIVGDHWSIARVTDSTHLMEVGDEVELK